MYTVRDHITERSYLGLDTRRSSLCKPKSYTSTSFTIRGSLAVAPLDTRKSQPGYPHTRTLNSTLDKSQRICTISANKTYQASHGRRFFPQAKRTTPPLSHLEPEGNDVFPVRDSSIQHLANLAYLSIRTTGRFEPRS